MEEDWVSKLKLFCDKEKIVLPPFDYKPVANQPIHAPLFTCSVCINSQVYTGKSCGNKKEAKQSAALSAYNGILHANTRQTFILVDVANFPDFINKIPNEVISSKLTTIYAFTCKPIVNPPTGLIIIEAKEKEQVTTPRTTHAYMSVYMGRLLNIHSEDHIRFIIVAGDKLATELIRIAKDDSLGWKSQEALHCKNPSHLLYVK